MQSWNEDCLWSSIVWCRGWAGLPRARCALLACLEPAERPAPGRASCTALQKGLAGAGRVALLLSPQCLPWAAAPKILNIQGQGSFPTWASHPSSTGHLSPLPPPPPTFIFEWTDTDCGWVTFAVGSVRWCRLAVWSVGVQSSEVPGCVGLWPQWGPSLAQSWPGVCPTGRHVPGGKASPDPLLSLQCLESALLCKCVLKWTKSKVRLDSSKNIAKYHKV